MIRYPNLGPGRPGPIKKVQPKFYNMVFTYTLRPGDERKIWEIMTDTIPDACRLFHIHFRKGNPLYMIHNIAITEREETTND